MEKKMGEIVLPGYSPADDKERYRLIFNNAPIGIFQYDTDGVINECNPKSIEMAGSTREKFIGINIFKDIKNKELIMAVKDSLAGKPGHTEGKYTSVTGGRNFFAKADFVPITSSDGKVRGGICVVEDVTKKVEARKALRQSEEKYRTILESIEDGYFEVDIAGNLIFFNKALSDILGYPESELTGMNYKVLMNPENVEKTFQIFNRVFKTGDPLKGLDWKIIRKDGSGRYLDTSVILIKNTDGNVVGFRGVARDVSDRRLMEKFLAESEERYRLIFESAPVGIFHYNTKGIIRACNQAFADIGKSSYDRLIGFNLLKDASDERVKDAIRKTLGGSPGYYEGEYTSVTGGRTSYIKADFEPVFSESESLVGGICVVEDITVRKKIEQALKESEARFRGLADRIPGIILLIDPGGICRFVSPSVERILGISPDEVIGSVPEDFLSPQDAGRVLESITQAMKDEPVKNFETIFLRKDGSRVIIEWEGIPVRKGVEIVSVQFLGRDVTDRKTAEEELKKSRQQLRALSKHLQQNREQERASIAREIHDDLGQALTAIKMEASWLKSRIPGNQSLLIEKAEDAISLVDSAIRSVKRISAELRPGLLDDLGLSAAIEWQAADYKKRSGINIHVTMAPEEISLNADLSIAIFRVCQESLTNVIRHSMATEAWVELFKNSNDVVLVVKDNGIGIKETAASKKESFGLIGMRERVHAFGGRINIFSMHDGGTKVSVRVPLGNEMS